MTSKIFIVSIDDDKVRHLVNRLKSIDDTIRVAKMFSTYLNKEDNQPYIDNDNLYLAYKNNAILCVKTIDKEVSIGYTKDEYEASDIICLTYELYNNMSQKKIKDVPIVWIDSNAIHKDKSMMSSAREFIELTKNRHLLYFTSSELDDYIITKMLSYVSGTEEEKKIIEEECK